MQSDSHSVEQAQTEVSIFDAILDILLKEGRIDENKLVPDATLDTLGLQSVDVVMAMMTIEEKFGVYIPLDEELAKVATLRDFVDAVARRIVKERGKSAG